MKYFKYILLIFLTISFTSCKTTREFYNKKGDLRNISDAKLISSVEDNYLDYNSLFLKKFKAEVSFNDETKSFKGNFFILKDSSIVVSINPLMGIELFRVRLLPGKVEIIDRTKKSYAYGDYRLLWDKFMIELDYNTLQRIITNEMFVYPIDDEDMSLKRYKHYLDNDFYELQSVKEGKFTRKYKKEKTNNIVYHQFSILPDIFKVSTVYIRDFSVNSEVTISYSQFIKQDGKMIPTVLNVIGNRGNDRFELTINFEHIELDGDNSIGFKVSDKYKQIDLQNER